MTEPAEQGGFEVVCVPIGDYDRLPRLDADQEAGQVAELLRTLGGRPVDWDLPAGTARTTDVVDKRLRSWAQPQDGRNSVLFWVGHGQSNFDGAWLATYDTPEAMNLGGVLPRKLADFVIAEWRSRAHLDSWTIVVIEACGAERFANLLHSILLSDAQPPSRFAVIGVGPPDGPSNLGDFRKVLDEVLSTSDAYTDCDDSIKVSDLVRQIQQRLTFGIVHDVKLHQVAPIPRPRRLPSAITATLDVYSELQRFVGTLPADQRLHFLPKAQGAEQVEQGEPAWYFVGRDAERARIAQWLRTESSGMLVVTGRAGSGKSALLGHVLVHATAGLRELLTEAHLLRPAPPGEFPDQIRFDAVVHLTGMAAHDLLQRLADAAEIEQPAETTPGQEVDWLIEALVAREQPFTVLVDALDEAQDPATIAAAILRRLAEVDAVRVVVGTRASTQEGPDLPEPDDEDLLDALGQHDRVVVAPDAEATGQYVRMRLNAALATDAETLDRVAELIERRNQQFLYARLAVHEIIANPRLLADPAGLARLLSGDHRTLFAAAVQRLSREQPVAFPLLEALALALGRGLPRVEGIWLQVATSLNDDAPVTELDIDQLLKSAAPYVMLDGERGQSVFRLAHRTFAEYFLAIAAPDLHRKITTDLTAAVSQALPVPPNPYVIHHLAGHAAAASAWDVLADATDVLDQLDPTAVAAEVTRIAFHREDLRPEIVASLTAQHRLAAVPPHHRATVRALAMARLAEPGRVPPPARSPDGSTTTETHNKDSGSVFVVHTDKSIAEHIRFLGVAAPPGHQRSSCSTRNVMGRSVRWARLPTEPLQVVLQAHVGGAYAVASVPMPDGRTLLASGGEDATVRLWDPVTGLPIGSPMTGHEGAVWVLTVLPTATGRTLLVSGGEDGTVRLWDPATGLGVGEPVVEHTSGILTVNRVRMPDGRTLLASAAKDGNARLWDPDSGVVTLIDGHNSSVHTIAPVRLKDGSTLLATADEMAAGLWGLNGQAVRQPMQQSVGGSPLVVTAELPNGESRLVSVGKFIRGRLTVTEPGTWQSHTYTLQGTWTDALYAITVLPVPDGPPLVATAGANCEILLWQPFVAGHEATSDLYPVGEALTGHEETVFGLASVELPTGDALLASASQDGTVRLWKPGMRRAEPTGAADVSAVPGDAIAVAAMTIVPSPDGPSLLAVATLDQQVRLWRTDVGLPVGRDLAGQPGSSTWLPAAMGVAAAVLDSGRVRLALGSAHVISIWDPHEPRRVGRYRPTRWIPPLPLKLRERWTSSMLASGRVSSVSPVVAMTPLTLPNGRRLLAVAGGRQIHLRSLVSGRKVRGSLDCGASVQSLAVVLSGKTVLLAAGTDDGLVRLWDPASRAAVGSPLSGHAGSVGALCSVPTSGGVLLASGATDFIAFWDPATGALVGDPVEAHDGSIRAMATIPTPDGALLVSGGDDGVVRFWHPTESVPAYEVPVDLPVSSLVHDDGNLYVGSPAGLVCLDITGIQPPA